MIFMILGLLFGLYVTYYFETRRMYPNPRHFPLKLVAFTLCIQFMIIGAFIDVICCHLNNGLPFSLPSLCMMLKEKH